MAEPKRWYISSVAGNTISGAKGSELMAAAPSNVPGSPIAGPAQGYKGWVDADYVGIDQGPIVAMIENYRSDLVWRVMRSDPYLRQGLERAGFSGGWLAPAQ